MILSVLKEKRETYRLCPHFFLYSY